MVSVPIDQVLQRMRIEGRNIFEVKDGTNTIYCNDDDQISVEEAANDLAQFISELQGSHVTVILSHPDNRGSNRGGTKKPLLTYRINLNSGRSHSGNNADTGGGNINMMLLQMMLNNQQQQNELIRGLADAKNEVRLKEIEFKLQRANEEKAGLEEMDLLDLFANKVAKNLIEADKVEKVVTGKPKPAAIAGTGDEPVTEKEPATDQGKRLKSALKKLQTQDPANFLENMEMLANYVESNPVIYAQMVKMMKGE